MKTDFIFILFLIFWLIAFNKKFLFWVYLWQLKEYHFGRFFAHFETKKGKNLIFDKLLLLKILFVLGIALNFQFSRIPLLLLFFAESVLAFNHFRKKTLKKPVLTSKIIVIISTGFLFQILVIFHLLETYNSAKLIVLILLFLDIFIVLFSSFCVFLWHPLSYLWRLKIIKEAKRKREKLKNLLVIGITGSYGKTSTKEILALILSKKYKVLKTKENQNSEVGISQCILNELKPEHEIFICEMAAYNKGGIKLLCQIAKPKIGIVCGVNEQHLATFGSMENLLSAEGGKELVDSLPEDGIVFFNARNKYCQELYHKTSIKKILYGENVRLAGLENIEGAKAVAKEMGMADGEISQAVEKTKNKFPGTKLKKGIKGINIIEATYSINPTGVIAHLEYMKRFSGKKVIIMPCLIELGKASKKIHRGIGENIGRICDLAIVTTEDRFKNIKKGWQKTAKDSSEIIFEDNPKTILEKIETFIRENKNPENVVLLEGRIPKEVIKVLTS